MTNASTRRGPILTTVLASLLVACGTPKDSHECVSSTQCNLSAGGVCTPDRRGHSFCQYPEDPTLCPGGWRWSSEADDDLSAVCVPSFAVTVAKQGDGDGTLTSIPAGIDCGTKCSSQVADGHMLVVRASPDASSRLGNWADGGASCDGETCSVTVTQPTSVTVTFTRIPDYELVVTKAGDGAGTVESQPGVLDCGAKCDDKFREGTTVTLAAMASTGSFFSGWDGACKAFGDNAQCTLTMNARTNVTATFTQIPMHQMTVSLLGDATGRVSSDIAGISCGLDCDATWPEGTTVKLTVAPGVDSVFTGWFGDAEPCELASTCSFTMTSNKDVGARFNNLGTAAWAKAIQGTTGKSERVTRILVDPKGDLFILGSFEDDTLTIDNHILQNHGSGPGDIFLMKLARDTGSVSWAKAFGGASADYPGSISLDPSSGDVILTALFIGDADFGGATPLPGGPDHFNGVIARYSGDDGSLVWSNVLSASGFSLGPVHASVGNDGFLHFTLFWTGSLTIGADTWNAPSPNLLIAKYRLDGQRVWIRRYGDASSDIVPNAIAVDSFGNAIVVGSFAGTWRVPFGGQLVPFTSHGDVDGFMIQFEPALGDWYAPIMRVLGGTLSDSCYAVAVSPQDDAVVGCVSNVGTDPSAPVDLDYGGQTPPSGPAVATGYEAVVAVYAANTLPGFKAARRFGGVGAQTVSWIGIDPILPEPRILVGGGFEDSIIFASDHRLDRVGIDNVWIAALRLGDLSFVSADTFMGANANTFSGGVDITRHRVLGVGDFATTLQAGGKTLGARDASDGYVVSFLPRL